MKHLLPKNFNSKNRLDFFKEEFNIFAFEITSEGECVGIYVFDVNGIEISFADLSTITQMGIEAFVNRKYVTILELEGA